MLSKKVIRKVFLDLDDVLNAFTMPALRKVGCNVGSFEFSKYPIQCGYNVVEAANTLLGEGIFTPSDFWNSLDREFWESLPRSQEFDYLNNLACRLVGIHNVCILTSSISVDWCIPAKIKWVKENARFIKERLIIAKCKHFLASHDSLLIDDRDENVQLFEKSGGNAILVPRPWNSAVEFCYSLKSITAYIDKRIETLVGV